MAARLLPAARGNSSLFYESGEVTLPRSFINNEKVNKGFIIKGSLAGAAVYVAYDQGLLGSGAEGAEALKKAQTVLPPAIKEWTSYVGWELPPTPKIDFSPSDSWNKGVQTVMSALSVAPTRACEYTLEGWKYMKDLVK